MHLAIPAVRKSAISFSFCYIYFIVSDAASTDVLPSPKWLGMAFIFALFFYFYLSPENLRGIGEFCELAAVLLSLVLVFVTFVFPQCFPFDRVFSRNLCDFPCEGREVVSFVRTLPENSVGKSSAKMRDKLPFLFSRIALTNRLRGAHNPKVVGSNPASATNKIWYP